MGATSLLVRLTRRTLIWARFALEWVGDTSLSGTIPESLNKLTALTFLDLREYAKWGLLDSQSHAFSFEDHFALLWLDHSRLSGTVPNSFSLLTALTEFDLCEYGRT
eukprot:SAG31_NODE_1554_length_7897_cov_13.662221_6_plen_107_part_00